MLRVGLLLEGDEIPAWGNDIIKKTGLLPSIQLVKIRLPGIKKIKINRAFSLFSWIDRNFLPGKVFASKKVGAEFPTQTPTLELRFNNEDLDELDVEKIKAINLDVILHFGHERVFHKSILSIPRLGVWTISLGNHMLPQHYAGFWEWFNKEAINSVAIIHQKPNQEKVTTLTVAQADTKIDSLSFSRNQTLILSKAIDLAVNYLNRTSLNPESIIPETEHPVIFRKEPTYWHLLVALIKLLARLTGKTFAKLFYIEQWVLFSSTEQNFPAFNFESFQPIIPPKDRFWADPFVVSQGDRHFVFMEELPYKTQKGHLTCLVLDAQGKMEDVRVILEKPYHLSYPFIFKFQDKWFMIPESAENRTVDLYECTAFPFMWEFRRSLLKGIQAYDSTLHFTNDRIWLFCTIQQSEEGSPNDDLYLFSTDNLLEGIWKPHSQNPVVSDPYTARPAGTIFQFEGNWYRPSQVCVPRYGYALAINRIDQLDEIAYRETRVAQNLPN